MKKLSALFLAGVLILSSCAAETPAMSEPEYEIEAEPLIEISEEPEMPEEPEKIEFVEPEPDYPPPLTEEEYRLQIANEIAEAFINKDIDLLNRGFLDERGEAFDFVNELNFLEFELTDYEHKSDIHAWVFYFNITVDDGTDDVFTLGGREWELQINDYFHFGALRQFSPRGKIINENLSDYALMCMQFSSNLRVFETMSDFNLLNDNSYWFYIALKIPLGAFGGSIETNEYIERAKYHFDIDITIEELIETRPWWENSIGGDGHGWYWHYSELVSEEYCENFGTVVINWFADTAYFIVARTMQFNLEFGEKGVKLISTELLYSNDDLILASNGT